MSKVLITFFSAEGTTARVAREFAELIGADTFEIVPEEPYTEADLNWKNPVARCNKEKLRNKDVPVSGRVENFADYDVVYIGFPIWYGCAPNVVNTFCREYDWSGKKVLAFATSGGSGIGKTAKKLEAYLQGTDSIDARVVRSASELQDWNGEKTY